MSKEILLVRKWKSFCIHTLVEFIACVDGVVAVAYTIHSYTYEYSNVANIYDRQKDL